jgi:hypothetical protein
LPSDLASSTVAAMSSGSEAPVGAAALFGRLRDLSAEAQQFRDSLLVFSREPSLPLPSAARDAASVALFEEARIPLFSSFEQMSLLLQDLSALFQRDSRAYCEYGDSLGRIKVAWAQAEAAWYRTVEAKGVHCSRPLATLAEALDSIAYDCCEITIPSRLKEHLNLLPVGDSLDFRGAYAKELSSEAARKKLLTYLKFYPSFLDGIIDIANQSIIHIATTLWGRIKIPILAVGVALLGFVLIVAAYWLGELGHLKDWPFTRARLGEFNLAYFFLLIGAVSHVVINLLKQDRSASLSPGALSKWILRLHVRQTAFLVTAVTLCLGAVALPFLTSKGISWQTAFFVGYSYDSFLDLFLKRFEDLPAVKSKSELLQFTNDSEGGTHEGIVSR